MMQSESGKIKFTSCYNVNEVFNEVFDLLYSRYQINLEMSMRESDFIFDSV